MRGGITFDQNLYNTNKFYRTTADYISRINSQNSKFDNILNDIKNVYIKQISIYEKIAKESNVPPELIAAIHYREQASDYIYETFSVYLHNGQTLGKTTTIVPKGIYFDKNQFNEAAVDALKGWDGEQFYKKNRAQQLQLNYNSKDITAMATYASFYNGWTNKGKSSYVYNGTNIWDKGLHTSDGNYDPDVVDSNVGVYPILKKLLE